MKESVMTRFSKKLLQFYNINVLFHVTYISSLGRAFKLSIKLSNRCPHGYLQVNLMLTKMLAVVNVSAIFNLM